MALKYKDVISLAEVGDSALITTIRQLGGSLELVAQVFMMKLKFVNLFQQRRLLYVGLMTVRKLLRLKSYINWLG